MPEPRHRIGLVRVKGPRKRAFWYACRGGPDASFGAHKF